TIYFPHSSAARMNGAPGYLHPTLRCAKDGAPGHPALRGGIHLVGMADATATRRYRFGLLEADVATGELRRQGIRIKINAQPFQVLCLLLDRPGELLSREEIARELWPDGTFVDYEH